MKIGQIVFIKNARVQTGIITRKEKHHQTKSWWYEVLCNDGENHVLSEHQLSPAGSRHIRGFANAT